MSLLDTLKWEAFVLDEKGPAKVSGTAVDDSWASIATAFCPAVNDRNNVPIIEEEFNLIVEGWVGKQLINEDSSVARRWCCIWALVVFFEDGMSWAFWYVIKIFFHVAGDLSFISNEFTMARFNRLEFRWSMY